MNRSTAHKNTLRAIREALLLDGVPCWRVGQRAVRARDGSYSVSGADIDAPDLFGVIPGSGRLLAVDVKTGKAILTPGQMETKIRIERAGGLWVTARSVDDPIRALRAAGYQGKLSQSRKSARPSEAVSRNPGRCEPRATR